MEKHEIVVQNDGNKFTVQDGANLLKALQENEYEVPSLCGGMGLCGKCRVHVLEGAPKPTDSEEDFFSEDELERGMRLSCRLEVESDLVLEVPSLRGAEEATAKAEMDEPLKDVEPNSGIERSLLELEEPGRGDQRSDSTRVVDALGGNLEVPLDLLRNLPEELRKNDFSVTATVDGPSGKLLSVDSSDKQYDSYGMAFDIGTTTVAGYGLDLETGETLAVNSRENPQGKFGADVVSRIKYARENEDGLGHLQEEVIDAINELVREFVEEERIGSDDIYRATFVGNTIMLHLLAGVDPTKMDQAPYIPGFTSSQKLKAEELGINIHPRGQVVLLPSLAGYVGADITAGILHTGMHKTDQLSLLVDIGTNGEMVLGNKNRMVAASTAAGPAFEGANIEQGMTARPGAISHVRIDDEGQLDLEVIEGASPRGLCGSGIVDTVGELLKSGLIEEKGNIVSDRSSLSRPTINPLGNRMVDIGDEKAFWLHVDSNPVFVTQEDIREVQLAKGAIKAGIDIMLDELGAVVDDIDRVYLAGAFGNYLRKENVLRIGVLPRIEIDRIKSIGNAAGQGAKLALISQEKQEELEELTEEVEYIELSFRTDFTEKFMSAMEFPEIREG
ncbi:MAG: ASKHA domain-containing protein [Candidatus Acetothermia bacterium]